MVSGTFSGDLGAVDNEDSGNVEGESSFAVDGASGDRQNARWLSQDILQMILGVKGRYSTAQKVKGVKICQRMYFLSEWEPAMGEKLANKNTD